MWIDDSVRGVPPQRHREFSFNLIYILLLLGFVDSNATSADAKYHRSNPYEWVDLNAGSKLWDIDHRFKARITLFKTVRVPHAHIPWDEQ